MHVAANVPLQVFADQELRVPWYPKQLIAHLGVVGGHKFLASQHLAEAHARVLQSRQHICCAASFECLIPAEQFEQVRAVVVVDVRNDGCAV